MRYLGLVRSVLLATIGFSLLLGREILGSVERRVLPRTANNCVLPSSSVQLDINNVRCLIHNGGDMWWDLVNNPRYEIPKVPPGVPAIHSMFAHAVWVGGLDAAGRLRLAAQTYRQSGTDYFAGPLSLQATTDAATCQQWDRHFVITRQEINAFRAAYQADPNNLNLGNYPNVASWPAINTTPGFDRFLAPFVDVNGDGDYTPAAGDYPDVLGDMAIWWVYNDKGNVHTETGAPSIGLEIQALAFAFSTTDQINNMTFYRYRIINRGTLSLTQAYMGVWVDSDLGFYSDDYVGCDTARGLGFCYNGDNYDDPPNGYGSNPPAIGTDFFRGPRGDNGQLMKMTNFAYYENDFSVRGNPSNPIHFYNYMRSIWKDGSPMIANGGNAYGGVGPVTNYVYTGYPGGAAQASACPFNPPAPGWDEASAGNSPFDRRYLQSAGPFTLQPGAVDTIVIGVPWARDANAIYAVGGDGRIGSVCLLFQADDIAQALFDNNFQLVEGPDAPDLEIVELDRELILKWGYKNPLSNNYREDYIQRSPVFAAQGFQDPYYRFEGYLVYQLRDARVGVTDLQDPNKAALIAQCDIKNGVTTIVNREELNVPGQSQPLIVDKVMVSGKDEGLFYSLRVTEDKFAEGTDPRLVNYRRYYFMIVAYAYNGDTANKYVRFILGRNNVRAYEAVPHKVEFEKMGTVLASAYGDGIKISRVQGQGNGGHLLRLTQEAEQRLFSPPYRANPVTYEAGAGPFTVKVVDPKLVKPYDYRLVVNVDTTVRDTITSPTGDPIYLVKEWDLYGRPAGSGQPYQLIYTSWAALAAADWDYAKNTWNFLLNRYQAGTERVIPGHGISISLKQPLDPGIEGRFYKASQYPWLCGTNNPDTYYFLQDKNNGLIDIKIEYADPNKPWWSTFDPATVGWTQGPGSPSGTPPTPAVPEYQTCQVTFSGTGQSPYPAPPATQNWIGFYDANVKAFYKTTAEKGWIPFGLWSPFNASRPEQVGMGMAYALNLTGPLPPPLTPLQTVAAWHVTFSKLPSVEVVITPDRSKWSKCLVLESSPSPSLSQLVGRGYPRVAKWQLSRDVVQGDTLAFRSEPLTVSSQGYSYFPGYAVNLETGERVNILFAEASWFRGENGDDMLFNPTSTAGSSGDAYAGRHWILVTTYPYDECRQFAQWLALADSTPLLKTPAGQERGITFRRASGDTVRLDSFTKYVAWVGFPRIASKQYEFKHYKDIPTEVRITLAVNKSYSPTATGQSPTFEFSTGEVAARVGDIPTAKNALDLIRIVPNPFYGRSGVGRGRYEISQVDSRAKITNLPQRCTIRIFTLNGVLVRTFRKDSEEPDIEWDLKNEYGVPIASGVYIIHIEAPGLGEKVIKFFAIMPQVDLNNY